MCINLGVFEMPYIPRPNDFSSGAKEKYQEEKSSEMMSGSQRSRQEKAVVEG
jgi:hypothetical protein